MKTAKFVVNGCGAAGSAIGRLLISMGAENVTMVDRFGALYEGIDANLDRIQSYLATVTNKEHKKGDVIHWSGVYTWFKSPVSDDDGLLCYEGIIDNQKVLFIDCKKSVNKMIQLPDGYIKKTFTIREKSESITIAGNKVTTQGLKIVSDGPGSCVITFNH